MKKQIKLDLSERSPELAEALTFFHNKLIGIKLDDPIGRRIRMVHEFQLVENLCLTDLLIDAETSSGIPADYTKLMMMKYLNDLTILAKENEILKSSLRGYLPRLEQICGRDENLRGVYEAYRQAFGGNSQ